MSTLPTDAKARKDIPVGTGFVDYFPDAMVAVAELSRIGNDQHNPGKPLHWDRSKSGDESDALMRHFVERGKIDTDGVRHSTKCAWRAMAMLQKEIEADREESIRKEISSFVKFYPLSDPILTGGWLPWAGGSFPAGLRTVDSVKILCRDGLERTMVAGYVWWGRDAAECAPDGEVVAYQKVTLL